MEYMDSYVFKIILWDMSKYLAKALNSAFSNNLNDSHVLGKMVFLYYDKNWIYTDNFRHSLLLIITQSSVLMIFGSADHIEFVKILLYLIEIEQ